MFVFEFLNEVVEIINTGPGQRINTKETEQAGTEGEKHWEQKVVNTPWWIHLGVQYC